MRRIYERDTDALFLRKFRTDENFGRLFLERASGVEMSSLPEVTGQTRHRQSSGTIDIELRTPNGMIFLIENKIDAGYSVTRSGEGQVDRYVRSITHLKAKGIECCSVLLAPAAYLTASRSSDTFDCQVAYEDLRQALTGDDLTILDNAIIQASTPYEPVANELTMDFFSRYQRFVVTRYPSLILKHTPNANGVRPDASRTFYFDVPKTLSLTHEVPRPKMSLQCWDSGAPSASVKIMIGRWGKYAKDLDVPDSLTDIGAYLRPAAQSLGLVVDTPRLDTQDSFDQQLPEVVDGLEAAARLQAWWAENSDVLREWSGFIEDQP